LARMQLDVRFADGQDEHWVVFAVNELAVWANA
jgi:hypothetical protein